MIRPRKETVLPDDLKEYVIVQDVINYYKEHEFLGENSDISPTIEYIKETKEEPMK